MAVKFGMTVLEIIGQLTNGFRKVMGRDPDGLEKIAEQQGFLEKGEKQVFKHSPIPDYTMPGISNESVATGSAGFVGTLLTFAICYGFAWLISKRNKSCSKKAEKRVDARFS